jgi:hypothetical protein
MFLVWALIASFVVSLAIASRVPSAMVSIFAWGIFTGIAAGFGLAVLVFDLLLKRPAGR